LNTKVVNFIDLTKRINWNLLIVESWEWVVGFGIVWVHSKPTERKILTSSYWICYSI